MSWVKKQFGKLKENVKDELEYKKQVRMAERESYKKARLEEAKKFGRAKASYETKQKLKSLKSPGYTFKGFAGPTKKTPNVGLGIAEYLTGSNISTKKKKNKGFDDMGLY